MGAVKPPTARSTRHIIPGTAPINTYLVLVRILVSACTVQYHTVPGTYLPYRKTQQDDTLPGTKCGSWFSQNVSRGHELQGISQNVSRGHELQGTHNETVALETSRRTRSVNRRVDRRLCEQHSPRCRENELWKSLEGGGIFLCVGRYPVGRHPLLYTPCFTHLASYTLLDTW